MYPAAAAAFAELRRRLGSRKRAEVAVLTASGEIDVRHPLLEAGALVLTTEDGAARLDGRLPAASHSLIVPGEVRVDLRAAVDVLRPADTRSSSRRPARRHRIASRGGSRRRALPHRLAAPRGPGSRERAPRPRRRAHAPACGASRSELLGVRRHGTPLPPLRDRSGEPSPPPGPVLEDGDGIPLDGVVRVAPDVPDRLGRLDVARGIAGAGDEHVLSGRRHPRRTASRPTPTATRVPNERRRPPAVAAFGAHLDRLDGPPTGPRATLEDAPACRQPPEPGGEVGDARRDEHERGSIRVSGIPGSSGFSKQ